MVVLFCESFPSLFNRKKVHFFELSPAWRTGVVWIVVFCDLFLTWQCNIKYTIQLEVETLDRGLTPVASGPVQKVAACLGDFTEF